MASTVSRCTGSLAEVQPIPTRYKEQSANQRAGDLMNALTTEASALAQPRRRIITPGHSHQSGPAKCTSFFQAGQEAARMRQSQVSWAG